jgi:hypothetical protein
MSEAEIFIKDCVEKVNNSNYVTITSEIDNFEPKISLNEKIDFRENLSKALVTKKQELIKEFLEDDYLFRERNFNGNEELIKERFDAIIKYISLLPKDKAANNSKNKQGTASQIALAFVIMMEENHFPQGIDKNTKQARFLEFLTGIGSEGLRKKIGTYKKLESLYLAEKKELESLKKDLEVVLEEFKNLNLLEESKKVKTVIGYIKAQIADFKDDLEK